MERFDQDNDGDFDVYDVVLLVAGLALVAYLWYMSMTWSVGGFDLAVQNGKWWYGWGLGFAITYLQIIFNRGSKNETLWWFGLASYGYGFATNLAGIIGARSTSVISASGWETAFNIFVVVFLAALVEWVPEHLVVRLLRPNKKETDFMSELRKGVSQFKGTFTKPQQSRSENQRRSNQNQQKRDNQQPRNSQPRGNQPRRENDGRDFPIVPNIEDLMRDR